MYSVVFSKSVRKFIEKHPVEGRKITNFARSIRENPTILLPNVLKLTGNQNRYRLRIGKYRLIYRINEQGKIIFFIDADSRGGIYK